MRFSYSIGEEDKVAVFLQNITRKELSIMQEKAPDTLKGFTWKKYNHQVCNALDDILHKK